MSTSAHISHMIAGGAFATGLLISLVSIWRSQSVQREWARHSTTQPKISKDALLSALQSIQSRAEKIVQAVDDAIAGAEDDDQRSALQLTARQTVQEELDSAHKAALQVLKSTSDDVSAAISFYTSGDGADQEVEETVASIKKAAGKYVLTKQTILDTMKQTYQLQAELMVEKVEQGMQTGAIRTVQQLQRFLQGPGFQAPMKRAVEALTLSNTGMSVDELDELTKKDEYAEDPFFQAGIADVGNFGQAVMGSANERLGQMMQELQQGGAGGGGMGMGF